MPYYMNDPREQTVRYDSGYTWEADNRVEERFYWNAQLLDLCNLPISEYMKPPTVIALNNGEYIPPVNPSDKKENIKILLSVLRDNRPLDEQIDDTLTEHVYTAKWEWTGSFPDRTIRTGAKVTIGADTYSVTADLIDNEQKYFTRDIARLGGLGVTTVSYQTYGIGPTTATTDELTTKTYTERDNTTQTTYRYEISDDESIVYLTLKVIKDGVEVISRDNMRFGDTLSMLNDITIDKEGYDFLGWQSETNEVYTSTSTMPAKNLTITAKYQIKELTVNFVIDGESVTSYTVTYGTVLTNIPSTGKIGYTFSGWDNDVTEPITDNIVFSGSYTPIDYTITWSGYTAGPTVQTLHYGDVIQIPADSPEKEGYSFTGWEPEVPQTMPNENLTFNPSFTINQYKVSVTFNARTEEVGYYNYGTAISDIEEDILNKARTFSPSHDPIMSEDERQRTVPAGDITIYLTAQPKTFTITILPNSVFVADEVLNTENVNIYAHYGDQLTVKINDAYPYPEEYNHNLTIVSGSVFANGLIKGDMIVDIEVTPKEYVCEVSSGGLGEGMFTTSYNIPYNSLILDYVSVVTPPHEGYRFVNFTLNTWTGTVITPETRMPAEKIKLSANYETTFQDIRFVIVKEDGTEDEFSVIQKKYDSSVIHIEKPALPENEGCTYTEWATEYTGASVPVGGITYKTNEAILKYTVSFNVQDSTNGAYTTHYGDLPSFESMTGVPYGTVITSENLPTIEQHNGIISAWRYNNMPITTATLVTVTSDVTINLLLNPTFLQLTYKVLKDDEQSVTELATINKTAPWGISSASTNILPQQSQIPYLNGYTLSANWEIVSGSVSEYGTIIEPITFKKVYTINEYELKFYNKNSIQSIGEIGETKAHDDAFVNHNTPLLSYINTLTFVESPEPEKYTYGEWMYKTNNSSSYKTIDESTSVTANLSLYRFTELTPHNVTYYNDEELTEQATAVTVEYSKNATLPADYVAALTGQEFYYKPADTTSTIQPVKIINNVFVMPEYDVVVYPKTPEEEPLRVYAMTARKTKDQENQLLGAANYGDIIKSATQISKTDNNMDLTDNGIFYNFSDSFTVDEVKNGTSAFRFFAPPQLEDSNRLRQEYMVGIAPDEALSTIVENYNNELCIWCLFVPQGELGDLSKVNDRNTSPLTFTNHMNQNDNILWRYIQGVNPVIDGITYECVAFVTDTLGSEQDLIDLFNGEGVPVIAPWGEKNIVYRYSLTYNS